MSNPGPWKHPPGREPQPARSYSRIALWIAAMLIGTIALVELARLFPDQDQSGNGDVYMVRNVALLALLSSGILYSRRIGLGELARNIAIWTAIAAVLLIGYAYQGELADVGTRLRSELFPSYAVASDKHVVVLTESEGGDYKVTGDVDGTAVTFVVDTGASDVVLSPADARRMGIDPDSLAYDRNYETANGAGLGAALNVNSITIGGITLAHIKVSVNRSPMSYSLLGMTFLKRLKSFEFRDRRLYLRS